MATVNHQHRRSPGFVGALRQLRDPLLLFAAPVTFALLLAFVGYAATWPIGFDFRGTLWEPARALLDGEPIYPEATRDAVVIGNPAVYPPLFILASVPLALLPVGVASAFWFALLGVGVFVSLRILGIRDWRCYAIALTSPVVVQGLYYGNLTLFLLLPLALTWRYRHRAGIAGVAVGIAVAAKLFVWPLIVWLLLTRRFRAAAYAFASATVLVIGAWATIGFEGLADYPALLRVLQDVYAIRSLSLSTAVGALGGSVDVSVAVAVVAGLACLVLAGWLVPRGDGERMAFVAVVAACVIGSPIVWLNYAALLLAPIAITWPRLAPAWFFGYAIWLVGAFAPKPSATEVCCRPPGVAEQAWASSHAESEFWLPAALIVFVVVTAVMSLVAGRGRRAA